MKGGRGSGGGLVSGVGGNGEGGGSRWAEGETLARGTGACGVRGCGVRCGLLRLIAALLLRLLGLFCHSSRVFAAAAASWASGTRRS